MRGGMACGDERMGTCRCSCFLALTSSSSFATMGSVDDDYKCPLCGRVGNGGYALDGVGFPICTEGDFSCLWFQVMDHGHWPEQIIGNAIQKIFRPRVRLDPGVCEVIAAFHSRHAVRPWPGFTLMVPQ